MTFIIISEHRGVKQGTLYFGEEQGSNTRIIKIGRFIADKVPLEYAVVIAAAMREADESGRLQLLLAMNEAAASNKEGDGSGGEAK